MVKAKISFFPEKRGPGIARGSSPCGIGFSGGRIATGGFVLMDNFLRS
jgi:hypothetical protein